MVLPLRSSVSSGLATLGGWLGRIPPLYRPYALAGAGAVLGLLLWVSGVDEALQEWLWVHYDQNVNTAMRWLGELGKGTAQAGMVALGGGAVALYGYLRTRTFTPVAKRLLAAIPVFAIAGVVNWVFKFVVGRPRPKEILMNGGDPWSLHPFNFHATFWSFPSGHACSTWAIAVWLALVFPRWKTPLFIAAVILSASRFLAVTPHYLGDVIAGGALGACIAMVLFHYARGQRYVD